MRCEACNCKLTDSECKFKFASGVYCNLCQSCLEPILEDVELSESTYRLLSVSPPSEYDDLDDDFENDSYLSPFDDDEDYWNERN